MNYRTSIDVTSQDYQLVLASQEMGTFYCVYASFKNDGSIVFKSKSYKGCVRIQVKRASIVRERGRFKLVKIVTSVNEGSEEDRTIQLDMKKRDVLVCHRKSGKYPDFLINQEEEYINIDRDYLQRHNDKTQTKIEQVRAESFLSDLDNNFDEIYKSVDAASEYFCVVGFSEVI